MKNELFELSCFVCKNNSQINNVGQDFALFNLIILKWEGWMRKWNVDSLCLNVVSKWLWSWVLFLNNNKNGYLNNMQMIYCNVQLQINVEVQKLHLLFAYSATTPHVCIIRTCLLIKRCKKYRIWSHDMLKKEHIPVSSYYAPRVVIIAFINVCQFNVYLRILGIRKRVYDKYMCLIDSIVYLLNRLHDLIANRILSTYQ